MKEKFLKNLQMLAHVCRHNLTEFEVQLYDENLRSRGYDRLAKGIERLLVTRKSNERFPSVAEIKELMPLHADVTQIPTGKYEPMSENTKRLLEELKRKMRGIPE